MPTDEPSRREFLKTAAIAAASVSVLGASTATKRARPRQKPLGFALVGLGSLSTNQIAPALQRTTNCRLAGIVTGTPEKVERWKRQYGIPERSVYSYDTMHRMADNADIDVVYVVTPNALHAEHTITAARAGKHVLCEKPMEVSVEHCQAMIDACRSAGRQLAIGYRCQFEPSHLACVRLARDKTFGDVRMLDAGFGFPIGDPAQWRLHRALSGGGPLMDVGIYALQTSRMIMGDEPSSVSALVTTTDRVKFKDVEESMTFQLAFPNGAIAHCGTSFKVGINRFAAFADRGSFGMDPAYNYSGNRAFRSDGVQVAPSQLDQFATEMDAFATCIMNGTPTSVPGELGMRDVRVLMAIYEAARTGRTVRLG
jgi:predicted dehydrogenase